MSAPSLVIARAADTADPEQGLGESAIPLDDFDQESRSETLDGLSDHNVLDSGEDTVGDSASSRKERKDFDDGANLLWSLYGNVAKTHDHARFSSLGEDMEGVLLFAGLFSGVLASFLVQKSIGVLPTTIGLLPATDVHDARPSLTANCSRRSTCFHSIHSLTKSTHRPSVLRLIYRPTSFIPSTIQQVSIPSTPPSPYPAFKPAFSCVRVNAFWLVSLVCVLSAALLAIFVKQWVRSYMQVFERYDHPLKRARFRQFFFEGAHGMRKLAEMVPRLIYLSLSLFFAGLVDFMLIPTPLLALPPSSPSAFSPYKTLISRPIFFLMQGLPRSYFGARFLRKRRKLTTILTTIERYQEDMVMEDTNKRKKRDIRAVRWLVDTLVDTTTVNAETQPLVEAIPGTFNTEWGREVWTDVACLGRSDPDALESGIHPASLTPHSPHSQKSPVEGTAADTICRCLRYLFETCNNHSYFENEDARLRRMRACVEATASLVCCIDFRLEWFGEVGKLVSEIGRIEQINQSSTTTSNPSFILRWTCLSLVTVQQTLPSSRLQVLADYAVSGLARYQSEYGQADEAAWRSAQKIEECLKTAWERAEELRRAFEPWTQEKTREQVEEILRNHEQQISDLERLKVDADAMEDVDWRISLYQDAQDEDTYRLTRQLPGVSFDERRRSETSSISDTFITLTTGGTPVTPQLIFPGQQVQALARLGSKLREPKFVDEVLISLRRPNGLMKRQLWRLQDLRDGGGFGYTRRLRRHLQVITSHGEESKDSLGTQRILLNIICDLIIKGRGVFSDFQYPERITTMLVDTVDKMLQGYEGEDEHIHDAVQEIASVDSRTCMDMKLWRKALEALTQHVADSVL
ncbi:hypothetical protein EI94DRAFT_1831060 [Lactarius quietus]|nr:hypothetical protein EI94DRAFT_1831060 [Lactarius quietus]